ncbi:hypothetical protein GGI04_000684 [Coemansia thaxteri]|nr:hypothetical protein GGI04_000684 [Coemansia thaxteri]
MTATESVKTLENRVIEPLRSRGWYAWWALRETRGSDEGLQSDASTVQSAPRGGLGELRAQAPFDQTEVAVWQIVLTTLGGGVGSGFLLAGGFTIFSAGPGGALVAFGISVAMLFAVMTSLIEVREAMGEAGPYYMLVVRVLGAAVGAAIAWNFWLLWVSIAAYEVVAVGYIVRFWAPHVHPAVWGPVALVCCAGVAAGNSRWYARAEHAFSVLRLGAVLALVVVGALVASGRVGGHAYGTENWRHGEAPFVGGVVGIIAATVYSNFSVVGVEAAAAMAVKSRKATRVVPVAVCGTLAVVFLSSVLVVGLVVPYDSGWFRTGEVGDSAASSVFTFITEQARMYAAAHVVNVLLLASALFDCCASLYVAAALLGDLATRALAPQWVRGHPARSLAACTALALAGWGLGCINPEYALAILAGAIGVGGSITWCTIAYMHCSLRWSRRLKEKRSSAVHYRAPLFPLGPLLCLAYLPATLTTLVVLAVWAGFSAQLFLFATAQLFVFLILVAAAAIAQRFGFCCCS